MTRENHGWLLLVLSLPTQNATTRMRAWRSLKRLGCASLRDGAYLLPAVADPRDAFARLAEETRQEGGAAWVLSLRATPEQQRAFRRLFDRAADYGALHADLEAFQAALRNLAPAAVRKRLLDLRKRREMLEATDYFPGAGRARTLLLWREAERLAGARLAPDEPSSGARPIRRHKRAEFQGRTWATRRNLWVDRMASAWLIARFVDRDPSFLWLDRPDRCPRDALGFDFDGAAFSHVGDRVTFETLLASFGLERNAALARLGRVVHTLDVGGDAPEAAGLEALLAGLKARARDDDALRLESARIFDDLYAAFSHKEKRS
jgi:hypothetical protein